MSDAYKQNMNCQANLLNKCELWVRRVYKQDVNYVI